LSFYVIANLSVSHPDFSILILSQPTSGLDSHNALHLCQLLKRVSHAGSSILFTIHQPSSEIFSSFDRLILLNKGRVMYQGLTVDVPTHFADRGFPCPQHYNPADHIMHVAVTNSLNKLESAGFFPTDTRKIGESFKADAEENKDPLGITQTGRDAEGRGPPPGLVEQTKELFQREIKNFVRNTHTLKTRTMMTLIISLLIGCLFWQVADNDFSDFINAQSTFGALLMALTANIFSTALPSLTAFPEERPVFLREYSTNHYSVVSYFASRLTIELAVNAVQVTVSTVITFFMVGFYLDYWKLW
jgi:energy-coupling factor transporter ATP-binding protein EcfA2